MMSAPTPAWFAPNNVQDEENVYFQARATLEVPELPAVLDLKICAESWYSLSCNEVEVGVGPARGTATLAFYDTWDLSPYLRVGTNTLRVLVGCANFPTFKAAPQRPALWVEIEGECPAWQVARDESFAARTTLYNFQTGLCEWRDLRVAPSGWHRPQTFALDKQLLPRDCAPLAVSRWEPIGTTFPLEIRKNGASVFDFGREIIGGAHIEIDAPPGTRVEIGYGEYLRAGGVPIHQPAGQHTYADRFVTRGGAQILGPTVQERGYRYLQLTADAAVTVRAVQAVDRRYPLAPPQHHGSTERQSGLYAMAHHTLSSCATDVLTDCPWREQALWLNDTVVSGLYWLEAGGDPRLLARGLRLALSERNGDALVHAVIPNGQRSEIVFLATNAFLPLLLQDLARFDWPAARALLEPVGQVLDALQQFGDFDGLLIGPDKYWNFLDWSFEFAGWQPAGRPMAAVNWFHVLGLDAMASLLRRAGRDCESWERRADKTAGALHARFWDPHRAHYREFEQEDNASELTQALACISGRHPEKSPGLVQQLANDGEALLKPELYMMHFVLRALLEGGHAAAAAARLERYWGPMLDANSPTVWEANVHQHGRHAFEGSGSLCHAFSCAPLWVIPRLPL